MRHPWFQGAAAPRVLAHRGLVDDGARQAGVAENSFAAVAAAHAAGASYVESDCHVTADGTVVLFHDASLHRVTGDARTVAEVTAAVLAKLMEDRGGLITLAQALTSFPSVRFNLDVKADAAAEPVGHLIADHADRVLLTSFSEERRQTALAAARSRGGSPATSASRSIIARLLAALATRRSRRVASLLADIDALQIPEKQGPVRILTPRLIDAAHENDTEVHVWTVNVETDMRRLRAVGVDGIVTDRADVALRLFRLP